MLVFTSSFRSSPFLLKWRCKSFRLSISKSLHTSPVFATNTSSSPSVSSKLLQEWAQKIQLLPEFSQLPVTPSLEYLSTLSPLNTKQESDVSTTKILLLGEKNVGRTSLLKVLFGVNRIQEYMDRELKKDPSSSLERCLVFRPSDLCMSDSALSPAPPWQNSLINTRWTVPPPLDYYFTPSKPSPSTSTTFDFPNVSAFQEMMAQNDVVLLLTDEARGLRGGWEYLFFQSLIPRWRKKVKVLLNALPPSSSSASLSLSTQVPQHAFDFSISTKLALLATYLPECHADEARESGISAFVQTLMTDSRSSIPRGTTDTLVHVLDRVARRVELELETTRGFERGWQMVRLGASQRVHDELARFQSSADTSTAFEEGQVAMAIRALVAHVLHAADAHLLTQHDPELQALHQRLLLSLGPAATIPHATMGPQGWMAEVPQIDDTDTVQDLLWHGIGIQILTWSSLLAGWSLGIVSIHRAGPWVLPASLALVSWTWLRTRLAKRRIKRKWESDRVKVKKINMDRHRELLRAYVESPLEAAGAIFEFNLKERQHRLGERLEHIRRLVKEIEQYDEIPKI